MGRQKQSIDALTDRGKKHLTKSEIEERTENKVEAPANEIIAPAYLSKKQKTEFIILAEQMKKIGIIGNIDADILGQYIEANTKYQEITKMLRKKKVKDDPETYLKFARLQNTYMKTLRGYANDLGLTQISRNKLVPIHPVEPPKQNKFDRFVK